MILSNKRYQNRVQEQTERSMLQACALQKRFTGIQLSEVLKISLPTVNNYLEKFRNLGYIKEIGFIGSDFGRKSRVWECVLLKKLILGVEIDTKEIKIALFRVNGELISLQTYPYTLTQENFCSMLEQYIRDFFADISPQQRQDIQSIGVSIPGDIDFDQKHIIFATNLNLKNLSIRPLEEALNIPIVLENEANAAALGEIFLDKNHLNKNMIFLSISYQGIGGGLIFDGKLYQGTRRKGGEIGHMSIDLNGTPCSCGSKGCWERYSSEEALQKLSEKTSLENIFLTSDLESNHVLQIYTLFLGRGIRNLLSIFDVSKICIGGNISLYWQKIYPYIYQEVFQENHFYDTGRDVILSAAKYQNHASLYGAAIIPIRSLFYEH
ncbi:MAG: ROK family protein [Brevinema sp.]